MKKPISITASYHEVAKDSDNFPKDLGLLLNASAIREYKSPTRPRKSEPLEGRIERRKVSEPQVMYYQKIY